MKIGIVSRWNATCGVGMHAELIGREFMRLGHEVRIFAPTIESASRWWHHCLVRKDEDYVVRCYEEVSPSGEGGGVDPAPLFREDLDLLIIESYVSLPKEKVEAILPEIRRKGTFIVLVVHEGFKKDIGYRDPSIFDMVVVFDDRYIEELLKDWKGLVDMEIIPFPCGRVVENRRAFGEGGLRFITFGRQPEGEYRDFVDALDRLSRRVSFEYRVIRADHPLGIERPWLKEEVRPLAEEEVYRELLSSDIHLLPKGNTSGVVVSSTLCQCVGTQVPILTPSTRHYERVPEDVAIRYTGVDDLVRKMERLIEDEVYRKKIKRAMREYARENSATKVALQFLNLLKSSASRISSRSISPTPTDVSPAP